MKLDKKFAQRNQRRISEKSLLIIAIIGGSIGIWTGMFWSKHKTKKFKFMFGIPFIIFIQANIYWLIFK
jgi:uncharacterized membrane protein YsdA (DUF1294 family)